MANIKLPESFNALLQKDQELEGIVKETLADYGEILKENNLFFFEEYTDHGLDHIESVLFGADKLITKKTYKNILKPIDITFFILAVILHDIGMHLTYEGFKLLINGEHDAIIISDFDKKTWNSLWEEYMSEAKRFSGKQLNSIFGNEETIIRDPLKLSKGEINGNDKKLIGEFIRRHHPRIAHEIALSGFPGNNKSDIPFAKKLELKKRDIIGLIARSHGVNLRDCVTYLELKFNKTRRIPLGIHVSYLMILLRLADYIQIDNTRTSRLMMRTKTFDSPISELEHKCHIAIDHIDDKFQDDPERIFITASPKDSKMYLKLKNLFKDIQREFDISWAVIGELYGNIKEKPEIKFRRINSNLDDDQYALKQDYVTDKFFFKANDEIIKLLIAPLYGSDPSFGVRELLQNSIDACIEREGIELLNNEYIPKVNIDILEKDGAYFIEIKDNGRGMGLDIIKNYFLSAGASYRTSKEWKDKFINDNGSTKIQRNGRFGIGVLACFLLGDKIIVNTREINNDIGYKFEASLSSDHIDIKKVSGLEPGTKILIKSELEIIEKLENDLFLGFGDSIVHWTKWYTLNTPKIKYKKFGKEIKSFESKDPHYLDSNIPNSWNCIDHEGFNKILWTYSGKYSNQPLVCNGIVIPRHYDYGIETKLLKVSPRILVFDNNALMPLSLNRNSLTAEYPFRETLIESIYKDYLAFVLSHKLIEEPKDNMFELKNFKLSYSIKNRDFEGWTRKEEYMLHELLLAKKGFVIDYKYALDRIRESNLIYVQSDKFTRNSKLKINIKDSFIKMSHKTINAIDDYKFALEQGTGRKREIKRINNVRAFFKPNKFDHLFINRQDRFTKYIYDEYDASTENEHWVEVNLGINKESCITQEFLSTNRNLNFIREGKIYHNTGNDEILDQLMSRYFEDDPIIPYCIEERRRKFPLAFNELANYMKKYL